MTPETTLEKVRFLCYDILMVDKDAQLQFNLDTPEAKVGAAAAFHEVGATLDSLRSSLQSGVGLDDKVIFPDASSRRIAIEFVDDYTAYSRGARSKVVESPKWRSASDTELSPQELLDKKRSGELQRSLATAAVNAYQNIRKKIVTNYRRTDLSELSDPRSDKQGIPARIRNARKDGAMAHFMFASDIRSNENHREPLLEFATQLDAASLREDISISELLKLAIDAEQDNSDAANFILSVGELWVVNTQLLHEYWQHALDSYNSQFPDRVIDPNDPAYQSN